MIIFKKKLIYILNIIYINKNKNKKISSENNLQNVKLNI